MCVCPTRLLLLLLFRGCRKEEEEPLIFFVSVSVKRGRKGV